MSAPTRNRCAQAVFVVVGGGLRVGVLEQLSCTNVDDITGDRPTTVPSEHGAKNPTTEIARTSKFRNISRTTDDTQMDVFEVLYSTMPTEHGVTL